MASSFLLIHMDRRLKNILNVTFKGLRELMLACMGSRSAQARIRLLIYTAPVVLAWRDRLSRPCVPGLVSIITPTYNRHQKLREAIGSLLLQTETDWEMIIIADGPDEAVAKLVSSYRDPRLKFSSTPWVGFRGNHQRNVGSLLANGEYLLYLDDDNILYPHALAEFKSSFLGTDIGYVICPIDYGDQVLMPTQDLRLMEVDTLNFMVRRSVLRKVGPWRWQEACDHDLISRISKCSRGEFNFSQPIGVHRN